MKTIVAFLMAFLISTRLVHWQTQEALPDFAKWSHWPTCNGNSCFPPLGNSMPCMAWLAWVDQSSNLWNHFIDFWHLLKKRHYLPNYPMNCCMHMLFENYISIGINEYSMHFAGYYCKSDEIADIKEVIFWGVVQSTNPCGSASQTSDPAVNKIRR